MAQRQVHAHLLKLKAEGKVEGSGVKSGLVARRLSRPWALQRTSEIDGRVVGDRDRTTVPRRSPRQRRLGSARASRSSSMRWFECVPMSSTYSVREYGCVHGTVTFVAMSNRSDASISASVSSSGHCVVSGSSVGARSRYTAWMSAPSAPLNSLREVPEQRDRSAVAAARRPRRCRAAGWSPTQCHDCAA